jgi:hypothetical protein
MVLARAARTVWALLVVGWRLWKAVSEVVRRTQKEDSGVV